MCDVHSPFYERRWYTARLVHHCDECRKPIMRGERYVTTSGVWDGDFTTYRAHELCDMLAEQVSRDDGCRVLGELLDYVGGGALASHYMRWASSLVGRDVTCWEDET